MTDTGNERLLQVSNLQMYFPFHKGILRRHAGDVKAVDGVTFHIHEGETLGLVGESGCGKTTIGRCLLRVHEPTGGHMLYRTHGGDVLDIAGITGRPLNQLRQEIRMVFQDPHASLNPRMTLRDIVGEPWVNNGIAHGRERDRKVASLLERVGLRPEYMRRYPHAFSGGERQRVGIARALATDPRLVVADEAVSALDVSIRAQIMKLLKQLQSDMGLTYLFISHDLSVIEYLCDRVIVMYLGRIVEVAETKRLFASPQMPYTEALLSAVPISDPRQRGQSQRIVLQGDVPDPANPPTGCPFHTRCPYAQDRCRMETPALREIEPDHFAACHFSEQLTLRGVGPGPADRTGDRPAAVNAR
jgi:peptide/nickel transport system ATP-binding protein